ncbi:Longitudinals lacking protein, isoform G [Ooceraea biroi]|uniref:Longitudinals lacking protein, isoform G n=1 Tax=Ooceraea biroi TaxID=2015173 RepID=A0A026W5B0_OOCBI|nr:Longitudinals lacking protein, isoform G [Ooceraea biroi]
MEDDQQFCLRWNNHQSTLIQNFDTLLESGTLVDCTLAAEGKYLKAHKVVLSACSPYFEGLLSEHYDKHPVFILKDVKFKELKAMMDYMYRGEVNISQDQLAALLKAAESLQIKGLSDSKTGGSSKTESRPQKIISVPPLQPPVSSLDIPHASSGLTIEKNKVPRQGMTQSSVGDLPEDTASPQMPKRISSREGSQSPTTRKRKRFRRGSLGEDNTLENQDTSNSSDMPQQMNVPALGIAPVADEKTHADASDSLGRSALMTQLTKPAEEMLQLPLEKPEPNDNLIEPKSEYLEEPEEAVEDLTLDDDINDLSEMEQDNNRAGPSHDPAQHPGLGAWHVTGDRSNAGGVVGSVAGAPGTTDEVFLAAQEAAQQAHRDSQDRKTYTFVPFSGLLAAYWNKYSAAKETLVFHQPFDWKTSSEQHQRHQQQQHFPQQPLQVSNIVLSFSSLQRYHNSQTLNFSNSFCGGTIDLSVRMRYISQLRELNFLRSMSRKLELDANGSTRGEGSKRKYSCKYCGKGFTQSGHLRSHQKSSCYWNPRSTCHQSQKIRPFSCTQCGACYSKQSHLIFHVRHECGRTQKCSGCGKTFLHSSSLRRHRQKASCNFQLC